MTTDKSIYLPRIVWCSSSTDLETNKYAKTLAQKGFHLEKVTSIEDSIHYLKTHSDETYLIISSRRANENLIQAIIAFENVSRIVFFNCNKTVEALWSSACKKVAKVCTKFNDILGEVENLAQRYFLKIALDCTPQSEFTVSKGVLLGLDSMMEQQNNVAYYHFETGRVLDFKLISLLSREQSTSNDVFTELSGFVDPDSVGAKLIQERFQNYSDPSFNVMKEFCYVYSTEYIYKQFNRACASRSYHKIIKSLAMLLRELKTQNHRVFNTNKPLYRGIPKHCMKIEDYRDHMTGFWPSFTSTSRNINIAREFAGEQGFIFVITLSQSNTHPNVILDDDWSKFPRQEEVLLLPYFSLKTTKIEEKDGFTYIYIEQNESDSVLSLHDMSVWTERIEEELLESMGAEVDKMSKEFCSGIDIASMLTSDECKSLLWDTFKSICKQEAIYHNYKGSWESQLKMICNNKVLQGKIGQKLVEKIPNIMIKLMERLADSLTQHPETKKGIVSIIREELIIRPEIYQNIFKGMRLQNFHTTIPWDLIFKEIGQEGRILPLLKGFLNYFGKKSQTDEEKFEEKVVDIFWREFCKNVETSCQSFNACSKELAQSYSVFFSEMKLKLQNIVKGLIREEK